MIKKTLIALAAIGALAGAVTLGAQSPDVAEAVVSVAEANDGCTDGARSRRAERAFGSGPAVCRTNKCHTDNARASASHWDANSMIMVIDWIYVIDSSAAAPGTPMCSGEVEAGGTSGWYNP
jgi:hypothetical protein